MKADFFEVIKGDDVVCTLCPHRCHLRDGQAGRCFVRQNVDGALVSSAYGYPVLMGVEPIEKKYLFHFKPGTRTFSLGTAGCNMGCRYCINWRVSQRGVDEQTERFVSPTEVVAAAQTAGADCIAFTYTEPTIFIEYARDIAVLAHAAGLSVVAKSNGFMEPAVMREMASWLDAICIDLKAWDAARHLTMTGAALAPVLTSLQLAKQLGIWVEVSTLLVPQLNTDEASLHGMAHFIADKLGADTPWHLLRFFPHYRLQSERVTAQQEIEQAAIIGRHAGLRFIYNREIIRGNRLHTYCPYCEFVVIRRDSYNSVQTYLTGGCCPNCEMRIAGEFGD